MSRDGRLLIDNDRVMTSQTEKSINPATLEAVGDFCLASSEECRAAIHSSEQGFLLWKSLPTAEKRRILQRAKSVIRDRVEAIARLITLEKGSPLVESLGVEVFGSLEVLDYYSRSLGRSLSPRKASSHTVFFKHKKNSFHFQPLGPTLVISPWNFPFLIPVCDILSALSTGNSVVFRPSSSTALTGLAVGEIFTEAGLPPGVLNVVSCRTVQAEEMITDPRIRTVMFTGSVSVGQRIMSLASRNLTNITLELGGKDPMIVCRDADLERAARGAVWSAFMNCGQSCGSVERLYVDSSVQAELIDRILKLVGRLRVGDPLSDDIDIGPMTTEGQRRVVEEHLQDALARGARFLCGGGRPAERPGYFLQPTVLTDVDHSMKVMTEETFGPVLPIMGFSELDEAVSMANDSRYGLTASVWTRSRRTASDLASRLEAGTVTVNDHMFSFIEPGAIWGGIKQSGIGRNHGPFGRLFLVNIKYVSFDRLRKKSQLWWFPYGQELGDILKKTIDFIHGGRIGGKLKALFSLIPRIPRILREIPARDFIKGLPRFLRK